mmetsp:Transcript_1029/g.2586  ORF Transcript_1029/g.2586 Transcript_1029/m.2586 type:complete len:260 (+) Transcript_1029:259-1038(+)
MVEAVCAVQHGSESPRCAFPASLHRLIPIGMDTQQVLGDALAIGQERPEVDGLPVAWDLSQDMVAQLQSKVIVQASVIFQDQRQRLLCCPFHSLQCPEVRCRAADCAEASLLECGPPPTGVALRVKRYTTFLEFVVVPVLGYDAFLLQLLQGSNSRHVHAINLLERDAQGVQPLPYPMQASLRLRQVNDVNSHSLVQPCQCLFTVVVAHPPGELTMSSYITKLWTLKSIHFLLGYIRRKAFTGCETLSPLPIQGMSQQD